MCIMQVYAMPFALDRHRSLAEGFARYERNPLVDICVVIFTSGRGAQHQHGTL